MEKEEKRRYIFAQLTSLTNPYQYVEVTRYIEDLENQLKKQKEIIDKAKEKLKQGITFCKNDSQGLYDKCNIAINREKKILQILEDKGGIK